MALQRWLPRLTAAMALLELVSGMPSVPASRLNVPHIGRLNRRNESVLDPDHPMTNGAMDPYIEGCSEDWSKKIQEAWTEAALLAKTHFEWAPGNKWQDAMTAYLGKGSADEWHYLSPPSGQRFDNIERQYDLHYASTGSSPLWTYGYFKCDPEKKTRSCQQGANAWAPKKDDIGWFWTNHVAVFCPKFFDDEIFTSLASRVEEANGDIEMQTHMTKKWRAVRARTMLHETYHWKDTVSQPKCDTKPEIYQPADVVALAASDETKTMINAESYAQAAMAIYIQKTFHLDSPPMPYTAAEEADEEELDPDVEPEDMEPPVPLDSEEFTPPVGVTRLSDFGSNLGPDENECYDQEEFVTEGQCNAFCSDGDCVEPASEDDPWVCNCAGGECKEGERFADFDECSDNCFQGMCSENAGEDGILCSGCS